ncbi:MAG: hypothetical protein HYZ63_02455 [Candidatus Andersenbacteria bacterium]|nr:hypothetical protein [Candidatus Andersenbacteria bacterium]
MVDSLLEKAIYDTVRYFDLFDMPLTATQIWRCLIVDPHGRHSVRWGGHKQAGLRDIQRVLQESVWLRGRLARQWGFFVLPGRKGLVRERLRRHSLAQQKWKLLLAVVPVLASLPFIRALLASGSLAIDNTKRSSDLDLFVIVGEKRIWTARLCLLLFTQLLGKRRTYAQVAAPDKVCLNHYVTDACLLMPVVVRNLYTAVQYTLHVPVYGAGVWQEFRAVNSSWIHAYVMAPHLPHVHHAYTQGLPAWRASLKRFLEVVMREPVFDSIEKLAKRVQLAVIAHHQRVGRIALSDTELAFHPDTKVPGILAQYAHGVGERQLPL